MVTSEGFLLSSVLLLIVVAERCPGDASDAGRFGPTRALFVGDTRAVPPRAPRAPSGPAQLPPTNGGDADDLGRGFPFKHRPMSVAWQLAEHADVDR